MLMEPVKFILKNVNKKKYGFEQNVGKQFYLPVAC